jgi:hypothetical protein
MRTKKFHIGDVLSITTGKLLSKDKMDGVYKILNWMSNSELFTHELPEQSKLYRPILLKMFPQLAEVDTNGVTYENWMEWLEKTEKEYGKFFEIPQIGEGRTEDPISSLERMLNK